MHLQMAIARGFFFVIIGFLLMPAITKLNNETFGNGFALFIRRKINDLGFITLIGLIATIWFCIYVYQSDLNILSRSHNNNILEYVYYVTTTGVGFWLIISLITGSVFFFVLYRMCRQQSKIFLLSLPGVLAISAYFLYVIHRNDESVADSGMGLFFPLVCMAIGILISYIPQIKKRNTLKWVLVSAIFFAAVYLTGLLNTPVLREGGTVMIWTSCVLVLLFLLLLYFSAQIDIPNGNIIRELFIYLGTLSLPLYVSQSILSITNITTVSWESRGFILILILSVLTCKQEFLQSPP
jgi:peptidoglycan/LPS O-acetylase OafA/YrhL